MPCPRLICLLNVFLAEVLQENLDKAEFEVEALDKLLDHVRAVLETGPSSEALAELLWELDDDNEDTPDASQ